MADLQYVMEVEPLDLGADVKAVGLDLLEIESREPARGSDAARTVGGDAGGPAGLRAVGAGFFRAPRSRTRVLPPAAASRLKKRPSGIPW